MFPWNNREGLPPAGAPEPQRIQDLKLALYSTADRVVADAQAIREVRPLRDYKTGLRHL